MRSKKKQSGLIGDVEIYLSVSSFDAATSALSSLFLDAGQDKMATENITELWTKLSIFKKGARRIGAREKQEHRLKNSEGKRPLSYQAYRELAKIMFASDDKRKVAAHAFLTLEWNLIARAENCINCKIDHIYFLA